MGNIERFLSGSSSFSKKKEEKLEEIFSSRGIEYVIAEQETETRTCRDKARLWKETEFRKKISEQYGIENIGVLKSLLLRYQSKEGEKYLLACTKADKKVDYNELRVELSLSREEVESFEYKDINSNLVLGKESGEIGPLISEENLKNLECVYFSKDLMKDAEKNLDKFYDVPLSLKKSFLSRPTDLFSILQEKSKKYKTSSIFEQELDLEVLEWKVKKVNPNSGTEYLFVGTKVKFKGKHYEIKNPKKDGDCVAIPYSVNERDQEVSENVSYEYNHRGRIRVSLPLNYQSLVNKYEHKS